MWWRKKVFGLEAALKAESLAVIPVEHATTAMAVLEAVGVPVTAGAEAAEKITELKGYVEQAEGDLAVMKKELVAAPDRARVAINTLRDELSKLADAAKEVLRLREGRVDRIRGAIVSWVNGVADEITDRVYARNRRIINKLGVNFSARINQVDADLKAELALLRDAVSHLEAESFAARTEITKLESVATKWTLPVPVKK